MDTEIDLQNRSPTSPLSPPLQRWGAHQDKADAILRGLSKVNEGVDGQDDVFDDELFGMLCDGASAQEVARLITEKDRKEATSITDNDIQRHLYRTATGETVPTKIHDWNMRCQDQATFLGTMHRAVLEWQHDVEGIVECLLQEGNYQSGVPLDNALPTKSRLADPHVRDPSIIDRTTLDLPYLPFLFATAGPEARMITANIRNRMQSVSVPAGITTDPQLRVPDGGCDVGVEEENQDSLFHWFSCFFGLRT